MRLLVTRPQPAGDALAATLRAAGHDVIVEPLLCFGRTGAAIPPGPWRTVLLTSANAVRALDPATIAQLAPVPALAVGERTAALARAAGFRNVRAAGGDASALADVAATMPGPVLYLAGAERTGAPDDGLRGAGKTVVTVAVYRMVAVEAFGAPTARALRAGAVDGVLLLSRRTAATFAALMQGAGIVPGSLRAYCLSAAVAEPLAGFGAIAVAAEPTLGSLLDLVPPVVNPSRPLAR